MHSFPKIIRTMKSKRVRWTNHGRNKIQNSVRLPERRSHSIDHNVDGRTRLKLILKKKYAGVDCRTWTTRGIM